MLSAWRSEWRLRVELFEQIRRDHRLEGLSIREPADRHHVHRRTVRQALASAVPRPRKAYPPRGRPAIDPYAEVIDGWLLTDRDVPKKQRHTARHIWQRLVAGHGARLAEVSRYVAGRKVKLWLDRVAALEPSFGVRRVTAGVLISAGASGCRGPRQQACRIRSPMRRRRATSSRHRRRGRAGPRRCASRCQRQRSKTTHARTQRKPGIRGLWLARPEGFEPPTS